MDITVYVLLFLSIFITISISLINLALYIKLHRCIYLFSFIIGIALAFCIDMISYYINDNISYNIIIYLAIIISLNCAIEVRHYMDINIFKLLSKKK